MPSPSAFTIPQPTGFSANFPNHGTTHSERPLDTLLAWGSRQDSTAPGLADFDMSASNWTLHETAEGAVFHLFAYATQTSDYAAFDLMDPKAIGWNQHRTVWMERHDGVWASEIDPPRWDNEEILGLTVFQDAPHVLLRGEGSTTLWKKADQGWQSEPLPHAGFHGDYSLSSDRAALYVMSYGPLGVEVLERRGENPVFQPALVQPGPGGGFTYLSTPPGETPVAIWWSFGLGSHATPNGWTTFLGARQKGLWTVLAQGPRDHEPVGVATAAGSTYVLLRTPDNEAVELYRYSNGSLTPCPAFEAADSLEQAYFLTAPGQAWLSYRVRPEGEQRLRQLDPDSESCLAMEHP